MTQHTSQHQYIFYVVTKHTDRINLSCIGFWFELRQSVSDPKWWENLSPVTCNRFVTPCVALPLHLSPDLRRFPPNSGALEAVKLLHTSAAVHSPNLLIISSLVILHKALGNVYVCFITKSLAAKKRSPKRPTAHIQ